ncbi:hypothetical protein BpHYR1_000873 [Brachionus plicatilis]|uniref:Uncharacterized protein n=1 Tax=Brachionus plicatilis TaxID=10195 RepID=A0A3M7R881_BRAPC|nr:hypothetical protein BpHYR1_000873 [Brachionus plicatilis]
MKNYIIIVVFHCSILQPQNSKYNFGEGHNYHLAHCCSPLNDNSYFQLKEELCLVSFNLKLDQFKLNRISIFSLYINSFFYFLLGPK